MASVERLQRKVALIIGASRGIGNAVAHLMLREGVENDGFGKKAD